MFWKCEIFRMALMQGVLLNECVTMTFYQGGKSRLLHFRSTEALRSTKKYEEVSRSTREVRRSTEKYQEVLRSTEKYERSTHLST